MVAEKGSIDFISSDYRLTTVMTYVLGRPAGDDGAVLIMIMIII